MPPCLLALFLHGLRSCVANARRVALREVFETSKAIATSNSTDSADKEHAAAAVNALKELHSGFAGVDDTQGFEGVILC